MRTRRDGVGVVDLARDLGVSTATVSRALNGSPLVRPELAERVRRHAEARGYVANRLARALSANTSRAFVGFVVPYVETPAYSAVAAECARLMSESDDGDTQMILTVTGNDPDRERRQVEQLLASRVAGLVISPSTHIEDRTRRLLETVPVVQLHRSCGIAAPGVFSDDEHAMAECARHLIALGHRRIGYLGTPEALSNGAARLRGVRAGARAAGLDPDAVAMRLVEPTTANGRAAARELLAGSPTALLVGGGSLSVGAAHAVRAARLRLPDDLSLVVYGDPDWFALSQPPLTTVAVDYQELARRAARLLLDRIDGTAACGPGRSGDGTAAPGPERPGTPGPGPVGGAGVHLIAPRLRIAGSTGPPPGRGPGTVIGGMAGAHDEVRGGRA